jgi:hypothetical protein
MKWTKVKYLLDGPTWAMVGRLTVPDSWGHLGVRFTRYCVFWRQYHLDFYLGPLQVGFSLFNRVERDRYHEDTGNYGN